MATMKSDLHNLIIDAGGVSGGQRDVLWRGDPQRAVLPYRPSSGTTVTIVLATAAGWQATATYTNTTRTCAVFYGSVARDRAGHRGRRAEVHLSGRPGRG